MPEKTKIEIIEQLIIGVEQPLLDLHVRNPHHGFRGRHIITNVPAPCMINFLVMIFSNVNVLIGDWEDAYAYREKEPVELDLPTLDVDWPIRIIGSYTGIIPKGMEKGQPFDFKTTILGLKV